MISEITYTIRAKINLLPPELGGRKKPVYSGYRPSFAFNTKQHYSGEIKLLDREELLPGNSALVRISLLPAKTLRKGLKQSDAFTIMEGNRVVGSGVIDGVDFIEE
ncbi:MAG: hypothetical protein EOO15_13425 [Chitinophagaceae bacterium]|nr:MAG: hypothetical protein EOO15_13425 [Chitinophagaceae bacterium]